jgi:hypothetical protein
MTNVMIDIPTDIYQKLEDESNRAGKAVEVIVQEWVVERVSAAEIAHEREQVRVLLRAAGLLTELAPELQERANQSTATLEEVQAAFARAGGKPLSEIVIEQRGPKL